MITCFLNMSTENFNFNFNFYTNQLKKNALPFIILPENYRIYKGRFV